MSQFLARYTDSADRCIFILLAITILSGIFLIAFNQLDLHFTHMPLFMPHVTLSFWAQGSLAFLLCLCLIGYGLYIQEQSPRVSTILWGAGIYALCAVASIVLTNGLQTTPFSPIDAILIRMDQFMGMNTPALIAWTHQHPTIHHIFTWAYNALALELIIIPIFAMLINARQALRVFFIAELSTFLVGSCIYYFFPTLPPAGLFHSAYFTAAQHNTALRFFEVHHYLPIRSSSGGLINFPSFHVIWATLLTYLCYEKKIIFYLVALFNIVLVLATLFLGWHYLMDVIAGFVLAGLGIWFGRWVCRQNAHY